ncbi:MAG: hypothetical protein IH831_05030 [Planctomycetes bacterium]|nr:hypothetical protein [Planctomycetota bacterium]
MEGRGYPLLGLFFSMTLASSNAIAGIVIDQYTAGPDTFIAQPDEFPAPFRQTGLNPATVLNGVRVVTINGVQLGEGIVSATIDVESHGGRFIYDASAASASPTSSGLIETMSVGVGDPDWREPASTFSVDLTADGSDRFAIEVLESNILDSFGNSATQRFNVRVASGDPGQRTGRFAGSFEIGFQAQPISVFLPFVDSNALIDFSKVAYVEIFTVNLWDEKRG